VDVYVSNPNNRRVCVLNLSVPAALIQEKSPRRSPNDAEKEKSLPPPGMEQKIPGPSE